MANDIRGKARDWLDKAVLITDKQPQAVLIYSDGSTAVQFAAITNVTQTELEENWKAQAGKKPPRQCLTSCNGFVGCYARSIGLLDQPGFSKKEGLGIFYDPLVQFLKRHNKQDSWVPASEDIRPLPGDIVWFKGTHVGVSIDFDGEAWITEEGGQGGPKPYGSAPEYEYNPGGHDLVKRRNDRRYVITDLRGWLDIERFTASETETADADEPADDGVASNVCDGGASECLWLTVEGKVVHPDAPAGGGGPGYFCCAGTLFGFPFFDEELLHPWAPAARHLGSVVASDLRKYREGQ